ncbi:MAG: ISL3 family transposase, partial [Actinobacteria bacterium]|nr:ISL3 family transposase [Actinomycetota bacterium]
MTLLPEAQGLRLENIAIDAKTVSLSVASTCPSASCPVCGHKTARLHSHYRRTVADLPWGGRLVRLSLLVRRFRCSAPECPRRIFAERVASVVEPYARKTTRLHEILRLVGFALGGEGGARLLWRLGMRASPSTLLRYVRGSPSVVHPQPEAVGIDDWAFRRSHRYGTILVDLERHEVIDLLEDREAATVSAWLKRHPEIRIIARDRGGAYAEAAAKGAPQAVQVADRWHLLKNATEVVQRFVERNHAVLGQAAQRVMQTQRIEVSVAESPRSISMLSSREERGSLERRQKRYARYHEVMELHRQGISERAIARALSINRATVRKFIGAGTFPERAPHKRAGSILEPYIPYIHRRWAEGCENAVQLWREIEALGYGGRVAMVRRYARRLRTRLRGSSSEQQAVFLANAKTFKAPSARRATWWLLGPAEDLDKEQQVFVEQLCRLCPQTDPVRELALGFRKMVSERRPKELDAWLDAAESSEVAEIENFARALRKDYEAVAAALEYEWSSGQVEGQINRLKLIKRQMYGRASFD